MNKVFILFFSIVSLNLSSQTKTTGVSEPPVTINFSDSTHPDYNPKLHSIDKHPIPSSEYGDKKEILFKRRMEQINNNTLQKKNSNGTSDAKLKVLKNYIGNLANGSPSDNDIAVSDNGKILSAVNTNINVYNDTGLLLLNKSLSQLVSQVGIFNSTSDPRVLYDPKMDRFIFVCFSGSLSTTNKILVGFSKTNDPAGNWNFYKLPGNSFNDSTWSDYPIVSFSDKDVFITFNHVKDNVSWTVGFKQSVIWQIEKDRGYNGDSLKYTLWSDIKFNNTNLRNICPAKNQTYTPGDNMYFLSVKNVAFTNDTMFLLEITNSNSSGQAALTKKLLKTPVKYGFPPNALQRKSSTGKIQQLMTNDARILAAIYENDQIHFGSNTIHPTYNNAGIMLGSIKNVKSNPTIKATIFGKSTEEYGYPSMTYMGNEPTDHKVLYTFSHCVTDSFAGMSMVYQDAVGDFTDVVHLKKGESLIDVFSDSVERWGDYSNAQRIFNQLNQAYIVGSYGQTNRMKTWIAKVETNDSSKAPSSLISQMNASNSFNLYPNPIENRFQTEFDLAQNENVLFTLMDSNGKLVANLLEVKAYAGKNEFSFNISTLVNGFYILKISGDKGTQLTKKIEKTN